MTKKEALMTLDAMDISREALRREVAREEAERPKKPGLFRQEQAIRGCLIRDTVAVEAVDAAADTLKFVRETMIPRLVQARDAGRIYSFSSDTAAAWLRELGE